MRLVIASGRYGYGGAERQAALLTEALEDRHDVTFITCGERSEVTARGRHRRIMIALPPVRPFWHNYWNPRVVGALNAHLKRIRPDLVHFHNLHNRTFSAMAIRASRMFPTVWTLHDMWSQCIWSWARPLTCEHILTGCRDCPAMPGLAVVNNMIKESIFRGAPVWLISPSRWLASRVEGSALAERPITVIPNGVHVSHFETGDRARIRRELGIPADARVVLMAGQMRTNVKGHEDLLRVARRLLPDEPTTWFLFVGPHEGETPDHPRILFTGAVSADAMPHYYAAADIFAYPTHSDTFALVVAEAMASGLPIVTYRVDGVPEIAQDGLTAFLVEEHDEAAFEARLRILLDEPERAKQMGRAGHDRVSAHFTFEQQLQKTEALYERVLAESPRRRSAT